ncbi:hypothetical protein GBN23_06345 [Plesiomonas shigelloides]|uniref:inverse autotransporter beta domain-containing protein n=1 Tax=Plesiomonas shigelloides TaxID=703 RepID=UPI0012613BCC|nr:inverse autotransporter beta domain-containing protein [Plesiomonas shigelloides]KAB7681179.1 hypothetical protein GBN23_06345 [Plesiomonas shigelloides]
MQWLDKSHKFKAISALTIASQLFPSVCMAVEGISSLNNMASTLDGISNVVNNTTIPSNNKVELKHQSNNTLPELDSNNQHTKTSISSTDVAKITSTIGGIAASDNKRDHLENSVLSIGQTIINQEINDWLAQKGKASLSLNSNGKFSGDILLPVTEFDNSFIFTQIGARNNNDRNTINAGVGYRHYINNLMLGINSFYDHDISGNNKRIGIGGEVWADYLKISSNGYFGVSDWHQSKYNQLKDYDEKPANGFDIKVDGYIPSYPQLGGSLKYEKYFGENVDISWAKNKNELKKNPYAFTLGLNYTPIPLVTISGEKSFGDSDEAKFNLGFNYKIGVPLSHQIDTGAVDLQRTLMGSKYDLVDRNNDIVMQYKKQELLKIALPEKIIMSPMSTDMISLSILKNKYSIKDVSWDIDPDFITSGGSIKKTNKTQVEITTPPLNVSNGTSKEYTLSAVAIDINGNESNITTSKILVAPSQNAITKIWIEPNASVIANNREYATVNVSVVDNKGKPVTNGLVAFNVTGDNQGVTLFDSQDIINGFMTSKTNTNGVASIKVKSSVAKKATIVSSLDNGKQQDINVNFIADTSTAKIASMVVLKNSSIANGKDTNTIEVRVTDANNNPIEGAEINIQYPNNIILKTPKPLITDANGIIRIDFASTNSGTKEVTIEINGESKSAKLDFIADLSTMKPVITAKDSAILADGASTTVVSLKLSDAHGNPIKEKLDITFNATNGASISQISYDGQGTYTVIVTSGTTSGTSTISASLAGVGVIASTHVELLPGKPDNVVSTLTATPSVIIADGKSTSTIILTLKDKFGNIVNNAHKVELSASKGSLSPVTQSGDGKYEATLTSSTTSEISTITAIVDDNQFSKITVEFIPGKPDEVKSTLSVTPNTLIANADSNAQIRFEMKDANGNAITDEQNVTFSSTLDTTISDIAYQGNGVYTAKLTAGITDGVTPVTVSINGSLFNVTPVSVTILPVELEFIDVNGHQFSLSDGFPSTGFTNAKFRIQIKNASAADYNWESDADWVKVGGDGVVQLLNAGASGKVTIDIKPKNNKGKSFSYSFNITSWFTPKRGTLNWNDANAYCSGNKRLPTKSELTSGMLVRQIGSLWGEWGKLSTYDTFESKFAWTSEQYKPDAHSMVYTDNGKIYDTKGEDWSEHYVICRSTL